MVIYLDDGAWGVLYESVCAADALRECYACSGEEREYSYHATHFGHVWHFEKVAVFLFRSAGVYSIACSRVMGNLPGLCGFT